MTPPFFPLDALDLIANHMTAAELAANDPDHPGHHADKLILLARAEIAGPTAFRDTLARLGLSQSELARILGHTRRSVHAWARGDTPAPLLVVKLLALIEAGKLTLDDLR
jgi:DNA-binding transcriptional regulator YiaG